MLRWVALALVLVGAAAEAADFRKIRPIGPNRPVIQQQAPTVGPALGDNQVAAPEGAGFVAVDPAAVRVAFTALLEKWNQPEFAAAVQNSLFDGDRFIEVLFQDVPRNARLRVLGVTGVTTLDQAFIEVNGEVQRSSIVSLSANTQVEFVDANGDFQRREGTNEFLIRVRTSD
ncbi:MAG: hypothetical protein ACMVY4_19145 [Minwuia sp.]|uniref:hypothetical protein n=1 Tax=Minwuia sp. TaxID=2493630 RepID=UPI003A8681F0